MKISKRVFSENQVFRFSSFSLYNKIETYTCTIGIGFLSLFSMKCPRCKWNLKVKDGFVKGKQRYRCKKCNYRYTVEAIQKLPAHYQRLSVIMYLEGYSLREIAEYVDAHSHNTFVNWLSKTGIKEALDKLRKPKAEKQPRNYLVGKEMDRWLTIAWNSEEDASVIEMKPKKFKPWGVKLGHKRLNTYKFFIPEED